MRDWRRAVVVSLAMFCLLPETGVAHHGYADRYDEEHPITLEGVVVELQFINPHSSLILRVTNEDGRVVRWNGYLGSATSLISSEGWTKNTLKPGDRITVVGAGATNGAPDILLARASTITMTDTGEEIKNSLRRGVGGRGF